MRGTVSTYNLDVESASKMLQGNLLPHPSTVLASIISVTFVGVGELPKNCLRSMFRVRRQVVLDALRWLKANNPKYYSTIEISDTRIAQLPEDDVPVEVLGVVRQSEDGGIIDQEHDGYVPTEEDTGEHSVVEFLLLSWLTLPPNRYYCDPK